jgi:hypothetical protein
VIISRCYLTTNHNTHTVSTVIYSRVYTPFMNTITHLPRYTIPLLFRTLVLIPANSSIPGCYYYPNNYHLHIFLHNAVVANEFINSANSSLCGLSLKDTDPISHLRFKKLFWMSHLQIFLKSINNGVHPVGSTK